MIILQIRFCRQFIYADPPQTPAKLIAKFGNNRFTLELFKLTDFPVEFGFRSIIFNRI